MGSQFPVRSTGSRELRTFDPLRDFRRQMDRLFEDFFTGGSLGGRFGGLMGSAPGGAALEALPRIDMREEENEL